jgi:hypothetical protein
MTTPPARGLIAALIPLTLCLGTPAVLAQANPGPSAPVSASSPGAAVGGIYAGLGTTGLLLGYSHSYSASFGSRLEVSGVPTMRRELKEGGIDYRGQGSMRRVGAALDWYPFSTGFRLSAGVSWMDAALDLTAQAQPGTSLTVGNAQVLLSPEDAYSARVSLPRTMPYVGVGWGRALARGWSVQSDLGALIGKPRVTGVLSASLRSKIQQASLIPDDELNRELQQVRDGVDKLAVYPVLQLALNYRW